MFYGKMYPKIMGNASYMFQAIYQTLGETASYGCKKKFSEKKDSRVIFKRHMEIGDPDATDFLWRLGTY